MFEGLLLKWQEIYHLAFHSIFRTTPEVSSKLTLLKYVKHQRSYGFLVTKELIFGFQILDFKRSLLSLLKSGQNLEIPLKCVHTTFFAGFLLFLIMLNKN